MSATVVDSSAWVDFLRGEEKAVTRVDRLLAEGLAAVTGPITAEVLSGARSSAQYGRLKELFDGLSWVPDPVLLWSRVAEYRFALARDGFQASLINLTVAVSALAGGHRVLTRDRGFERICKVVPIELDLF